MSRKRERPPSSSPTPRFSMSWMTDGSKAMMSSFAHARERSPHLQSAKDQAPPAALTHGQISRIHVADTVRYRIILTLVSMVSENNKLLKDVFNGQYLRSFITSSL